MRIPNLTIYHSTNVSLTSVKRLVFNGYALVSLYAQLNIFQFKITRSAKWFRENSLNMVLFQSRLKDKYIVFCLSVAHLFICLFLVSPFLLFSSLLFFVCFVFDKVFCFDYFCYHSDSRNGWTLTLNWLQVKLWRRLKTTNQRWRRAFFFCYSFFSVHIS